MTSVSSSRPRASSILDQCGRGLIGVAALDFQLCR
jgi:hypothetical protein